ncbi:Fc.00g108880.m01.CDS01 [Cosmosporella sp. VM-42]
MAPPFPKASIQLSYPLYAVDFDPEDANRLVVGGGGGASRTGVGNKISVLETVSQTELRVAGEIDLSKDEDSVMSLAVGAHKGKTTYVYAGVNSSPDSIAKGKNEHLRTFGIEQSKSRASTGAKATHTKITELSRNALFTDLEPDTYQRTLRVAGPLGIATTAMGRESQLAVYDTATARLRGLLELEKEAEDVDIVQTGENEFQVAFCYKYELHIVNIGKENSDSKLVFTMPEDENEPRRPAFRSIRYLTPTFLLAVSNLPKRSGVLIQGLRLHTPGKEGAGVTCHARIPRNISATAMAVTNLNPPASPTTPVGETQFVIAIAGHDSSISLFTLEHKGGQFIDLLYNLWPLRTINNAHCTGNIPANITGVALSTFVNPNTHVRQQYIKLASISIQKTVFVHSIPLKKFIERGVRNKRSPPRPVRYVTAMKSTGPSPRPLIITLTILVLLLAVIGQSIRELYGKSPPIVHAHKWVPGWHGTLRTPDHPPTAFLADEFLSKLGSDNIPQAGETLVVYEDTPSATGSEGEAEGEKKIQVEMHDPNQHGPGKTWEELPQEQKEAWKSKLKDAGAWTQHMGESVFQGILFGEMAGAVGRAVAG